MRKIFLALVLLAVLAACKKSSTTPGSLGFSGKYYSFKRVDTIYSVFQQSTRTVVVQTPTNDTSYTYSVATKQLSAPLVQPDAGRFIRDTVAFTTSGDSYFITIPTPPSPAATVQYDPTNGQIGASGRVIFTTSDPTVIRIKSIAAQGIVATFYKKI